MNQVTLVLFHSCLSQGWNSWSEVGHDVRSNQFLLGHTRKLTGQTFFKNVHYNSLELIKYLHRYKCRIEINQEIIKCFLSRKPFQCQAVVQLDALGLRSPSKSVIGKHMSLSKLISIESIEMIKQVQSFFIANLQFKQLFFSDSVIDQFWLFTGERKQTFRHQLLPSFLPCFLHHLIQIERKRSNFEFQQL